jgi:hypothetical protein
MGGVVSLISVPLEDTTHTCAEINGLRRGGDLLAPKMNQSLWLHFVVDSMAIGCFLKFFFLSSSSSKT